PAHQDRLGRRAALAAEEAAGDLARRVRAFLDVYGEREEVEAVPRQLADARGGQQHGLFVQVCRDGALSLLCEATGLEPDHPLAELAVVDHGLGELDLWTLQRG